MKDKIEDVKVYNEDSEEIYDEDPTMEEMVSELAEIGRLEGAEYGDWLSSLANVYHFMHDSASNEFKEAYENEIRCEYIRIKTEFIVIEEEITRTFIDRRLEYIG